jgi:arabinofuranosyltransferase
VKEKHWTLLVGTLISAGLIFAWFHRHVEDDAFITFRYSQHLVEGFGPVWNTDQRVEGYTNFLWMLLMCIPIALGVDPVLPSILLGLACTGTSLWFLFLISKRQTESAAKGFWAWLPLVFSHTLLIFSTSGMETAFNGLLWTIALWQLQPMLRGNRIPSPKSLWLLGITCALAVMCRPEGGLLVLGCAVAIWMWLKIARHGIWVKFWHFAAAVLLPLLPWLIWKLTFYGSLLPNTFYVKTGSGSWSMGLQYSLAFLLVSGFWIPELLMRTTKVLKSWNFDVFLIVGAGLVTSFVGYTAWAGGDYLEFRLMVPILPILLLLPGWRLARKSLNMRQIIVASVAMAVVAVAWGQGHGRIYKIWYMNSAVHPTTSNTNFLSFADQGKALGELLGHDRSIRLAIGACGGIPYYSRFYGIDLYGLNEPRNGFVAHSTGYGPGHAKLADFSYVQARKPHLISLRCEYLPDLPNQRRYIAKDPQIAEVLHGTDMKSLPPLPIIELPLGRGFVEVCIYSQSHPKIDSVIKINGLKIYTLELD